MADKRYCSIFVRLTASDSYHLHLRSVWLMILDISQARKILKEGGFPTYIHIYIYIGIYSFIYISTVYVC